MGGLPGKVVDTRRNKRPVLRDLMPPTQPVADVADMVLFTYHDVIHSEAVADPGRSFIEMIIAKQDGPPLSAKLMANWESYQLYDFMRDNDQ